MFMEHYWKVNWQNQTAKIKTKTWLFVQDQHKGPRLCHQTENSFSALNMPRDQDLVLQDYSTDCILKDAEKKYVESQCNNS
jgi:hypothetical protein